MAKVAIKNMNITSFGGISDISKCFENFVPQTLGVLARIYAAELRDFIENDS